MTTPPSQPCAFEDRLNRAMDEFIAAVRDVPRGYTRALSAGMTEIQLADTILDVIGLDGRRRLIAAINARTRQIVLAYPDDDERRNRLLREVDADIDVQDPNINREEEMLP